MLDRIFPFLHLGALLAVAVYAIGSLVQGNVPRFGLIAALLTVYYVFILHPAVRKEIARRRDLKRSGPSLAPGKPPLRHRENGDV